MQGRDFVADDYSIADIAIWPWISRFEWQTIDMKQYPNVRRWYETIAARPAVQKGYKVPEGHGPDPDAEVSDRTRAQHSAHSPLTGAIQSRSRPLRGDRCARSAG